MDQKIDSLFSTVRKLAPSISQRELEYLISEMSLRSGIPPATLLTILYEDLRNNIPFRYTAVGKSRTISHW